MPSLCFSDLRSIPTLALYQTLADMKRDSVQGDVMQYSVSADQMLFKPPDSGAGIGEIEARGQQRKLTTDYTPIPVKVNYCLFQAGRGLKISACNQRAG